MITFQQYMNDYFEKDYLNSTEIEKWRKQFVRDYPRDSIISLSLSEYLYVSNTESKPNSFCQRLTSNPSWASLGRAKENPNFFGIYLNIQDGYVFQKYYKTTYQNNIEKAFEAIKRDIVLLLKAGENNDYSSIDKINLW